MKVKKLPIYSLFMRFFENTNILQYITITTTKGKMLLSFNLCLKF